MPSATGLSYSAPAGTGWRFVADAASTDTHLILNLVGPAGGSGSGVGFTMTSDSTVGFASVSGGGSVVNRGFSLGSGVALQTGVVQADTKLLGGVFQKGAPAASYDAGPLLAIAIDLKSAPPAGTPIALAFAKAKALENGALGDVSIALGTLTTK